MADEHPRLTTPEVCALARYSRATLFRRIDVGDMPKPIDRGGSGYLFDRRAVLRALGLDESVAKAPEKSWDFDPAALHAALARKARRPQAARGRDVAK